MESLTSVISLQFVAYWMYQLYALKSFQAVICVKVERWTNISESLSVTIIMFDVGCGHTQITHTHTYISVLLIWCFFLIGTVDKWRTETHWAITIPTSDLILCSLCWRIIPCFFHKSLSAAVHLDCPGAFTIAVKICWWYSMLSQVCDLFTYCNS